MRYRPIAADIVSEPLFEPPPQLSARPERRLTAWVTAAGPRARGPHALHPNAVTIVTTAAGGAVVQAVGVRVAATFGLSRGPLRPCAPSAADVISDARHHGLCRTRPDDLGREGRTLAALLDDACTVLRVHPLPLPFDGVVGSPQAACIMLRGVLLPLDAPGCVEAVLSWKEVLDADATARLRAEMLAAFARVPALPAAEVFAPHRARRPSRGTVSGAPPRHDRARDHS